MNQSEVAGIILTGGRSTRMGLDKATLSLAGRPMCQWVADALRPLVDRIILVGAIPGLDVAVPLSLVVDNPPGFGPLGGLATGLEASGKSHHLVVAADYPLVRPELLRLLLNKAPGHLAVCGRTELFLEPLVGYYHSGCAPVARAMLAEGELRTHLLFKRVASHVLSDEEYEMVDPANST
ncbi:MAG: molybdenum cofactor guanylyltransferase [candidate division Zixibacteria bacterium]|nr:molybdenum cofactor guanylyltransferase [candidate division Zixibacteria bacterium]